MCKRLIDRRTIITGAARGMGLAIAEALYHEGAKTVLVDVDEKGGVDAARGLDPRQSRAFGKKVDVTNKADVRALVEEVKGRWGGIDLLVNNAGGALGTPHRLEEIEDEDWNLVVNVNLKGAFLCSQAVIPEMAKQGRGVIVNMSALAGHWRASLAGVQYTAAKAGIEGLTRQLAYDWGKSGIRVNAVAPTVTLTGDRIQVSGMPRAMQRRKRSSPTSLWAGSARCRMWPPPSSSSLPTNQVILPGSRSTFAVEGTFGEPHEGKDDQTRSVAPAD